MELAIMKSIKEEIKETIIYLAKIYNLKEEEAIKYIECEEKVRGRPRKEREKVVKGARGRPRKVEKEERSYVGEDLIGRLIEEARKKIKVL